MINQHNDKSLTFTFRSNPVFDVITPERTMVQIKNNNQNTYGTPYSLEYISIEQACK